MSHQATEVHVPKPRLLSVASFNTARLEARHGYEAWRSLMGTTHEIEADPSGFSAEVRSIHLDRMVLHLMDAPVQKVSRTSQRIRRDGLEHFVLHLSSADGAADTPDGSVALKAGRIIINDLTQSSVRGAMPDRGAVIVSLSRDLVAEALGDTNGLHGLVLDSEPGLLLATHLRALGARADAISAEAAPGIARATAHLLAASVADRRSGARRAEPDGTTFLRARRFIEENLGQPELTPELVARASAVSRSSLFRMFQPLGGVSAFVQKRRLDRIKACLTNPSDLRPVSALAYAHGFVSVSHFSQVFRERFGCTPGDMREGRFGVSDSAVPVGESLAFKTWLKNLG